MTAGIAQQLTVQPETETEQPSLLVFSSPRSGPCRRAEGFLAQVLQRRSNHDTFRIVRVPVDERPDLAERFRVSELPTFMVVEGTKIAQRIVKPRGCRELERQLAAWLN